jgi:hypothetical protein
VPWWAEGYGPDLISEVIGSAVRIMDEAGRKHHGCQSMPSLNTKEYRLAITQGSPHYTAEPLLVTAVKELLELTDRGTGTPYPGARGVELMYVGPFGPFQIDQCLRLGGRDSVEVALSHWNVGQKLLRGERVLVSPRPVA